MKAIFVIGLFIMNFGDAFSQISDSIISLDDGSKIVWEIDTSNYKNWKVSKLTYFAENNIEKREIGFIKPKSKELFYLYKKEVSYYKTGQKKHELILINNIKDSIETFWYETGQRSEVVPWNKGRKNGRSFLWYENGNIKNTRYFRNDTIFGDAIWFHPQKIRKKFGDFITISKYKNGKLKSTKSFRDNGILESETIYNDTARITKYYYKSGNIKRKDIEKNSEYLFEPKNKIEEYYRDDGTLKMKIINKNGRITINDYDENGKYIDWNNEEVRRKRLQKE